MKRILFLSILTFSMFGCNGGKNQTNIELIQNMMDQESVKSQDWDPRQGEKLQMRTPPAHSVSRGHAPYAYASDPGAAEKQANPLAGNMSPEVLTMGRKKYDIYCLVCHGPTGAGNGPVAEKMAVKPRSLINDEAKAFSDGRIYHAITAGKGVMGSYGAQIRDAKDRWAIVNYVRSLQKQ